jgi:hypothetical protein
MKSSGSDSRGDSTREKASKKKKANMKKNLMKKMKERQFVDVLEYSSVKCLQKNKQDKLDEDGNESMVCFHKTSSDKEDWIGISGSGKREKFFDQII